MQDDGVQSEESQEGTMDKASLESSLIWQLSPNESQHAPGIFFENCKTQRMGSVGLACAQLSPH